MGITEGSYDEGGQWILTSAPSNFFVASDGEIILLDNIAFVYAEHSSWVIYFKHGTKNTYVISDEDYRKLINLMGYE
jgi:hypothetical protein